MLGTRRVFFVLILAVLVSRFFQQTVGPSIHHEKGWVWGILSASTAIGDSVLLGWTADCEAYDDDPKLTALCVGRGGALRPLFLATLFFFLHAAATHKLPLLHSVAWKAKYTLFFLGLIISIFVPTQPLFGGFFLFVARCGAVIYMVSLQPIVLVDEFHNWHKDCMTRGDKWLQGLSISCVVFCACALLAILNISDFGSCVSNTVVGVNTFLGVCLMMGFQWTRKASPFPASVMSIYVVYLAFLMAANGPNASCNPLLGQNDFSAAFYMEVYLGFLCFAWLIQKLKLHPSEPAPAPTNSSALEVPFLTAAQSTPQSGMGKELWKLNAALAVMSCWFAMTLTGWGILTGVTSSGDAVSPIANKVIMTILGIRQWVAIAWYIGISYYRPCEGGR